MKRHFKLKPINTKCRNYCSGVSFSPLPQAEFSKVIKEVSAANTPQSPADVNEIKKEEFLLGKEKRFGDLPKFVKDKLTLQERLRKEINSKNGYCESPFEENKFFRNMEFKMELTVKKEGKEEKRIRLKTERNQRREKKEKKKETEKKRRKKKKKEKLPTTREISKAVMKVLYGKPTRLLPVIKPKRRRRSYSIKPFKDGLNLSKIDEVVKIARKAKRKKKGHSFSTVPTGLSHYINSSFIKDE